MTCGGGVRQRERQCNNPEPEYSGKTCEEQGLGPSIETEACNVEVPCSGKQSQDVKYVKDNSHKTTTKSKPHLFTDSAENSHERTLTTECRMEATKETVHLVKIVDW